MAVTYQHVMRFTQLCDKSAARLVSRPDVRLRLTFGPAILVTIQLILVEFPTTTRARETVISIMRFANLLVTYPWNLGGSICDGKRRGETLQNFGL
jgi:hypothetical protein